MIGNPKWFRRRKYGGWGISPKTWQGWLYTFFIIVPFAVFQALPYWSNETRIYVTLAWLSFLLIDVTHIMFHLDKDEREFKIEAIAERNSAWTMVIVLAIGVLYQAISSGLQNKAVIDPFLIIALLGGALVKTISNVYLERKKL